MGPNERALRVAYARYAEGDVESVVELFAADVVIKSSGAPNRLAHSGAWQGLEGVRGFLAAIGKDWSFTHIEMLEMLTQDDRRFVVRSAVTGINRRTHGKASVERVDLVTMEGGKCKSYSEIFDTAPLERASRL